MQYLLASLPFLGLMIVPATSLQAQDLTDEEYHRLMCEASLSSGTQTVSNGVAAFISEGACALLPTPKVLKLLNQVEKLCEPLGLNAVGEFICGGTVSEISGALDPVGKLCTETLKYYLSENTHCEKAGIDYGRYQAPSIPFIPTYNQASQYPDQNAWVITNDTGVHTIQEPSYTVDENGVLNAQEDAVIYGNPNAQSRHDEISYEYDYGYSNGNYSGYDNESYSPWHEESNYSYDDHYSNDYYLDTGDSHYSPWYDTPNYDSENSYSDDYDYSNDGDNIYSPWYEGNY